MEELKRRILQDGKVRPGNILKVDSFLNHQLDPALFLKIAWEFKRIFAEEQPTKILTVESSGIAVATVVGLEFGVPVIFAKKSPSKNLDGEVYHYEVYSYTHAQTYDVQVEAKFLRSDERVLIIDDFLANGRALIGLIEIVKQSGAHLCGCGVVIEKGFQEGGRILREQGVNLHSLAVIDSMEDGKIVFRDSDC